LQLLEMQVTKIPLGAPEVRLLRQLPHLQPFNKLIDCIRAELAAKTVEAKIDLASHLFDEGSRNIDATVLLREAARLQVTLDVIDEFLLETKELYSTKIEV